MCQGEKVIPHAPSQCLQVGMRFHCEAGGLSTEQTTLPAKRMERVAPTSLLSDRDLFR